MSILTPVKQTAAAKALRRFQKECADEKLGLECALSSLAFTCLHLQRAREAGTVQEWWVQLGNLQKATRNVKKALQAEYPDLWDRRVTDSSSGGYGE